MNNWVAHLKGLEQLEKNAGKKVAFSTSARIIEEAELRIVELEQVIQVLTYCDETGYIDGEGFVQDFDKTSEKGKALLEKLKLEQQAKGIEVAINHFEKLANESKLGEECRSKGASKYNWMKFAANELRKQAEKL